MDVMETASAELSKFKLISVFVFIGFLITVGLLLLTLANPATSQYHIIENPATIKATLTADPMLVASNLAGIALDNFFIVGYFAIFYGLYLLTKPVDINVARAAFLFGSMTVLFDLLENSVLISIFNGVPAGYEPDNLIFGLLWVCTSIKDSSSYISAIIFFVLLLQGRNHYRPLKTTKIVLALFLLLYFALGSLGIISSIFLLLRNLSFVVDMAVSTVLFYKIRPE
jgi:hypothetical protein